MKTSIKFGNQYGCGEQLNCRIFITLFSYFSIAAKKHQLLPSTFWTIYFTNNRTISLGNQSNLVLHSHSWPTNRRKREESRPQLFSPKQNKEFKSGTRRQANLFHPYPNSRVGAGSLWQGEIFTPSPWRGDFWILNLIPFEFNPLLNLTPRGPRSRGQI